MTADDIARRPGRRRWTQSSEPEHLRTVLELVASRHDRGQTDLEVVLREINDGNVGLVPGAQYAGITLSDSAGITTLAATHRHSVELDDAQREAEEGPCLSAAWSQHTIRIDDLSTDERWPRFREAALRRTPIRSVLSFRLFAEKEAVGALNFQAQSPGVFDDESVEVGLIVATHTMVAWNQMRRERQFRSALASRDLIGQAKGILMERFGIDAVAAFELLKRLSQETNVKIADLAERLARLDHPSD